MDKIIESNFNQFGSSKKQLKPSTIKGYMTNIRNLQSIVEGNVPFISLDFLNNKDNVLKLLGDKSASTKRNYVNSAIASLHTMGIHNDVLKDYENLRDILQSQYIDEKVKNKGKTTQQKDIFKDVSKEDIDKILDVDYLSLVNNKVEYQNNMIMNIYRKHPFRNELADAILIKSQEYNRIDKVDDKRNYVVIKDSGKNMSFILNTYKTSERLGKKEIDIADDKLILMIRTWLSHPQLRNLKLNEVNYKPFLCFTKTNTKISRNDLSAFLRKFTKEKFGHSISSTIMCKYYSPIIKDKLNPTKDEMEALMKSCKERGHSVSMNLLHYNQS